jgi:nucleotide-binding universal stress UspA family protein
MAHAYNSEVTLISVLDPLTGSNAARPIDPLDWQIQRAESEVYLHNLSSRIQSSGLKAKTIMLEGKAPDGVIHHSNLNGTNLIVLSSHGQGGISGWNTSSVVAKIIQQARTSVMIIRSYLTPEHGSADLYYRRILAPVDGSKRAEYALFAAAHLARAQGAELLLAHVIKPPELPRRTPLSVEDRSFIKQIVESNQAEAFQYLNHLKATLDCRVDTLLQVENSVAEALHALVEQERIDLIILNAHGFGGNPRWPFGNVAVNFLAYSAIPLLIVQDFAKELLVETNAETYANDFLSQPPKISNEVLQRFWEVYG